MNRSVRGALAMPRPSASFMTQAWSPMASCFGFIFQSPMIRPRLIARARISDRIIVRAIFPQNAAQRSVSRRYIALLNESGRFSRPIATTLETGRFYDAEDYHQDFMNRNPRHPYILAHDVEKVEDLRETFPRMFTRTPAA